MLNIKSCCAALLAGLCMASAGATALRLQAAGPTVTQGSLFTVNIVADIDAADAIIGFGFDLSAIGVALRGFTAGPGFADDPQLAAFSDADGIRGASGGSLLLGPPISGLGVLLGQLLLEAVDLGPATISLSADDLGFNFTEGLIPLDINLSNFMPAVTAATVNITPGTPGLPEPTSLACVGLALALLWQAGRRRGAQQQRQTLPSVV